MKNNPADNSLSTGVTDDGKVIVTISHYSPIAGAPIDSLSVEFPNIKEFLKYCNDASLKLITFLKQKESNHAQN